MKATEIQWSFDKDEIEEMLESTSREELIDLFCLSEEDAEEMDKEALFDYAISKFHHSPALLDEFFGLPNEVEIPEELTDEEDISDWLSDEYGFCHEGFVLSE